MFTEILVPLDGGRLAEDAIPIAAAIAERHGARLHFVAVSIPASGWLSGIGLSPEVPLTDLRDIDRITRTELENYLSRWATNVGQTDNLVIRPTLLDGTEPVGDQLLAYCDRHRINLIVMHTHARNVVGKMWLGSVADALLHRSGIPCLLLRGPAGNATRQKLIPINPHRILVPLDGSSEAELAMEFALASARPGVTTLSLVAVLAQYKGAGLDDGPLTDQVAMLEAHLHRVGSRAEAAGIAHTSRVIMHDQPAKALLQVILDESVDLVTIAAHHRSAPNRVFLGSVTDYLLRHSQVPILAWRSRAMAGTAMGYARSDATALAHD